MKKITTFIIALFITTFVFTTQVSAVDFSVDCDGSGPTCSKSGLEPLFPNSEIWYPGKVLTKSFSLKNSSSETRSMAFKSIKTSEGSLQEVILISLSEAGGPVLWSGTLADLYLLDQIELGNFSSGTQKSFNIQASMSPSAGNEYQNKSTIFDLKFGLFGSPISTSGGGSGGSGGSGGGSAVAPSCNDTAPSGAPVLLLATVTGPNQVTLSWSKAPNPVTYYLVTFGLSSGAQQYGNPNIGDSNTTSYTVNGLSGGATYYFRVRAGNGCNAGPFSNELSATPGGPVLNTIPDGFLAGVLGTSQDNIGEGTSSAKIDDILGTNNLVGDNSFWQMLLNWIQQYWWALLLILLLLFLFWRRRHQEQEENKS